VVGGRMARVRLENVTKRFGDVVAVNNLSYEVGDGEFLCMLGPSGAGKTTTMRMIAGVERPDEGNIYIGDVPVNDVPPKERDVAMMFQSYALYSHKTVYKNLAFPLEKHKVSKDEVDRRVKEVAEILGISHLLDRLPKQLSGGEKQRVALGRTMVRKPEAYLLDEPLTNLDAKLRAHMRAELKKLREELKTTIIYATPDQLEAMSMADRIAVMNFGKLLQCDTSGAIYNHPKNLFVAGFIGSPAMNFIDCTFVEKEDKAFLDAGEFLYDITELKNLIKDRYTSPELILGIRPEHISISKKPLTEDSIEAEIYVIEPSRPDVIVSISVGAKALEALAPETFRGDMGEKVWITFDRSKVYVFDKKTENAII